MKTPQVWSIRSRLILLTLAVLLPAMAIILHTGLELRDKVVAEARADALRQVQAMAARHVRVVDMARLMLATLAKASEIRNLEAGPSQALFSDMLKNYPAYASLCLADGQGRVVAFAPSPGPNSVEDQDYFRQAVRTGRFVTGGYVLDQARGRVYIHFAQPVLDPAGQPAGVLAAGFDLNYLGLVFQETNPPENSVFTMTDAEGLRLIRFPEASKYTWVPDLPRMVEKMKAPEEEGAFLEVGVDGLHRLYGYKRLRFDGAPFPYLMIRLGIPVESALAEARFVLMRNLVLLLLTALASMFLAWLLGESSVMRPLDKLVEAASRLGQGDLSVRAGLPHRGSELGRLAQAFDAMAENLQGQDFKRRQAEDDLLRLNEELEERVANRTKELVSTNQDLRLAMDNLRQAQNQLVQSEKLAGLGGLVAGVAHEINTPVGIGVTAASHLEQKTGEFLDLYRKDGMTRSDLEGYLETARESSAMILGNLNRAADLIGSFKKVAVDQSSQELRTFRVKEYLREILLSLHPRLRSTNIRVQVDCPEDLTARSYPGAFSQIIANLVLNSLAHGFAPGQEGRITVAVSVDQDRLILKYADNGRGMAQEVLGRIFEPFFTTNRARGGTGLGLFVVYNLVTQTLGGKISCESAPNQGAVFTVSLPYNPGS
jgi:signal transduction histidine kinase